MTCLPSLEGTRLLYIHSSGGPSASFARRTEGTPALRISGTRGSGVSVSASASVSFSCVVHLTDTRWYK